MILSALSAVKPQLPKRKVKVLAGSANTERSNQVRLAQNVLVFLALASITYFFAHSFDKRANGVDFPEFYAAARMVSEGCGHQLYDFQAQDRFQIRYAGRTGTYYNHPPFETLLYLPFSFWSLHAAYLLWCLFNAGVLTYTAIVFQRHVCDRLDWRVLLLLFFLFPPVLLNFLQGQDSLLLLLIMTLAVVAMKRGRNFTAGCLLGCGLFKFHVILSFALLVASLGKKGLLRGLALVFVTLLLISTGISGWGFLTAYPRFLMKLSSLALAGIHPAQMANLRGLVGVSGIVPDPAARLALTLAGSVAILWLAWRCFRGNQSKFAGVAGLAFADLAFGNFVLAAILVSYHLSPHDLCIALLPVGLLSQYLASGAGIPRWARLILISCQCVFFLPPLHVILLARHGYAYAGIPILIMFLLSGGTFAGSCQLRTDS
jgi:hypothetical protein